MYVYTSFFNSTTDHNIKYGEYIAHACMREKCRMLDNKTNNDMIYLSVVYIIYKAQQLPTVLWSVPPSPSPFKTVLNLVPNCPR